ncbi:MAG: hypothetical protein K8S62_07075 [Candidatus Sabulitectum sp.]|nr:hypothetical protein [Candidatus Sabulitectum sp.]
MERHMLQIDNADPIGRFLRRHDTGAAIAIPFLIFAISCLLDYIQALQDPLFFDKLTQNTFAIAVRLFIPLMTGAYIWIIKGINKLFKDLSFSGVFSNQELMIDRLQGMEPLFRSRSIATVIAVFSCLIALAKIVCSYLDGCLSPSGQSYFLDFPGFSFSRAPFWFILSYSTGFLLLNTILTISSLRKLLRVDQISLWLSHPDGCGGLSPVSKFNLGLAIPFASIGILLSLQIETVFSSGEPDRLIILIIGILIYFIAGPLVFILPLSSTHRVMIREKQAELLRMAEVHGRLFNESVAATSKSTKDLKDAITKLEDFNVLYKIVKQFPVWPIERQSAKRFGAIISAPILSSIILEIIKSAL